MPVSEVQLPQLVIPSIYGDLRAIYVPVGPAFDDMQVICKSVCSWREELNKQEVKISGCLALGYSNRQIADELGFPSEKSASDHVQVVLNKMRVEKRGQVASIVRSYGVMGP